MYNFKHRDLIFLKQRKAHRYIRFERRTPGIKFSKVEEYIKISLGPRITNSTSSTPSTRISLWIESLALAE